MFQQVVRNDEIVDGYGDGDRGDPPSRYSRHPPPLQPLPPYYFILTAHNLHNIQSYPALYHYDNVHVLHYDDNHAYHSPNTKHHNAYHASHNPLDNGLSDNALHHAHNDADKHGLNHAQAATALSPL